jgi:hypothetical protein
MTDIKTQLQAKKALDFLNDHPAFINPAYGCGVLGGPIWFFMAKCCKRGLAESSKSGVRIYKGMKGWEKYKEQIEKKYKDEKDTPEIFKSIDIPYKEYYGEAWKFDHIEYWYETTFYAFHGDPNNSQQDYDCKHWQGYSGPQGGANTFDEMLIACAKAVKKAFGNFNSYYDMHTKEELANYKENAPMLFEPIKGDTRGCSEMLRNPKYIYVSDGMLNLRWLKWYSQTKHCQKNWGVEFDKLVAKVK